MPQSCTVCRHPELAAINGALVENEPLRKIANRFGTTAATVYRHRQHLPSQLTQARQAQEMANATTMLERIGSLIERLSRIAQKAEEDRAWSSAAAAIREIRACLTLLAQLTGELQERTSSNISISLVSQRIQASLLAATPEELGRFLRELLEKATKDQRKAALAAAPPDTGPDLSMLTVEELDLLERLSKKVYG
jgi:hypothetical protein